MSLLKIKRTKTTIIKNILSFTAMAILESSLKFITITQKTIHDDNVS